MLRVTKEKESLVADAGDEVKSSGGTGNSVVKPLHKLVTEHKDVAKLAMQLNSAVLMHRVDVYELLTTFSGYHHLWTTVSVSLCYRAPPYGCVMSGLRSRHLFIFSFFVVCQHRQ